MARIVLENLSKKFVRAIQGENRRPKADGEMRGASPFAVSAVNLTVEDKELLVLVGPSGSGKTTLLRMIAGLEDVTSGAIYIDGARANEVPPKDRDIAMVFQNYALYPHMTAYENMALGLKLRKFARPEIERRVRSAAEMLGLLSILDRRPSELSGGERQRVAVARAIVRQPKAFLFDEPFSNLDAQMRGQMRLELSKLHKRLGATMLFVTHDQVEAMTLGNRVAVMRDGTIQQVADPLTLYQRPANMFVAGFIGSPAMNLWRGKLWRESANVCFHGKAGNGDAICPIRLDDGITAALQNYAEKEVVLGIRPENISVDATPPEPASRVATGTIDASIEVIELTGPEIYLGLKTAAAQMLTARVDSSFTAALNQKVTLFLDMQRAHFFDPVTEKLITHPLPP